MHPRCADCNSTDGIVRVWLLDARKNLFAVCSGCYSERCREGNVDEPAKAVAK